MMGCRHRNRGNVKKKKVIGIPLIRGKFEYFLGISQSLEYPSGRNSNADYGLAPKMLISNCLYGSIRLLFHDRRLRENGPKPNTSLPSSSQRILERRVLAHMIATILYAADYKVHGKLVIGNFLAIGPRQEALPLTELANCSSQAATYGLELNQVVLGRLRKPIRNEPLTELVIATRETA